MSETICKECEKLIPLRGMGSHVTAHGFSYKEYLIRHFHGGSIPVCGCGCGKEMKLMAGGKFSRFSPGHQNKGLKRTEEWKTQQSKRQKLRLQDPAERYKAGNGARGKSPSLEHRESLRKSNIERLSDPVELEKQRARFKIARIASLLVSQTEGFRDACRDAQVERFSRPEEREKYSHIFSGEGNPRWNPNRPEQTAKEKFNADVRIAFKQAKKGLKSGFLDYVWSDLGYTSRQLKEHIEQQFSGGMSWENWGTFWQIDHIRPVSRFSFDTQISVVNALSNLRPLSSTDNRIKGKRLDEEWKAA